MKTLSLRLRSGGGRRGFDGSGSGLDGGRGSRDRIGSDGFLGLARGGVPFGEGIVGIDDGGLLRGLGGPLLLARGALGLEAGVLLVQLGLTVAAGAALRLGRLLLFGPGPARSGGFVGRFVLVLGQVFVLVLVAAPARGVLHGTFAVAGGAVIAGRTAGGREIVFLLVLSGLFLFFLVLVLFLVFAAAGAGSESGKEAARLLFRFLFFVLALVLVFLLVPAGFGSEHGAEAVRLLFDRFLFFLFLFFLVLELFVLVFVVIVFLVAPAAEKDEQDEDQAEHGDEDVRDVEDRQLVHEGGHEHVLDIAAEQTVDAVGQTARHDEQQAPAADGGLDELRRERDDHKDREHGAEDDEKHPRVFPAQEAEGGAVVMDVHQLDQAGDQLARAGVERDVPGDPELRPLVEDDDQQRNNGIQHVYLLSAAQAAIGFRAAFPIAASSLRKRISPVRPRRRRSAGTDRSRDRPSRSASSSAGTSCRAPR